MVTTEYDDFGSVEYYKVPEDMEEEIAAIIIAIEDRQNG
jgi:hypothetical protein